jgi:hypothetical protein
MKEGFLLLHMSVAGQREAHWGRAEAKARCIVSISERGGMPMPPDSFFSRISLGGERHELL